jgi:predicted chitinase
MSALEKFFSEKNEAPKPESRGVEVQRENDRSPRLKDLNEQLREAKARGDERAVARLEQQIKRLKEREQADATQAEPGNSAGGPGAPAERQANPGFSVQPAHFQAPGTNALASPANGPWPGSLQTGFQPGGLPAGGFQLGAPSFGAGQPGFLGGGSAAPSPWNGNSALIAAGCTPAMAGVGTVGNINIEKLVNAIDPGYRESARKHWPAIVAECQKQGVTNKAQIAYILATTVHESGAGKFLKEFDCGTRYENRSDLGNSRGGDGVRYKGRGYVQITGRRNYTDWSRRLGVDLVGNPQLAERPEVAAKILVGGMKDGTFTGRKLGDYINGSRTDFANARRTVNGTDKAGLFAATAQKILAAMS